MSLCIQYIKYGEEIKLEIEFFPMRHRRMINSSVRVIYHRVILNSLTWSFALLRYSILTMKGQSHHLTKGKGKHENEAFLIL